MDFVTLASATAPRRLLRHLASAAAEDDDFTHLAPPPVAEAGADYASGGLYGEAPGTPYEQQLGKSGAGVPGSSSPLLSPSAEAELFMLATNFLLCKSSAAANPVQCGPVKGHRLPCLLVCLRSAS